MSGEPRPVVASHARFPLVDGVRAIAALTIFLYHVSFHLDLLSGNVLSRYLANLNVGVPIFFVISGFLLYRPFVAARLEQASRPATGPYAARRVTRIVPAYWVALPIVAVMLGIESEVFTPGGIVTYFGFLQLYDPQTVTGGIGQAWTLCIEVTFYAALVFWAIGARSLPGAGRREIVRWELVSVAGLFAFSLLWQLVLAPSFDPGDRGYFAAQVSLPVFADQFALGMGLAVISASVSAGAKLPQPFAALERRPWGWVVLALGLYALLGLKTGPSGFGWSLLDAGAFRHVVKGLIGACVLAPAVFGAGLGGTVRGALGWRPLLLLGLVSYSFYLYHLAFILTLDRVGWLHGLGWPAVAGAAFACSVAVAAASYRLVEAPGIALGRRWAARIAARQARTAG